MPDEAKWFEGEFKDYLTGDKSRSYVRDELETVLDDYDMEESVREKLIEEFKTIIVNVLSSPIEGFLRINKDIGFDKFLSQKKTTRQKVIQDDKGKDKEVLQDLTMANESNKKFIANKKVGHLMSDKVANRLKGDGVSQYGELDDLPKFDFDDWGSELEPEISIQLAFEESKSEGNYSYTHKKKHFSGKDGVIQSVKQSTHLEVSIPSGDILQLIDAQTEHLHDITGMTGLKYKKEKSKVIIKGQEPEQYDVNLVIPADQWKKFEQERDTGIGETYYEVKYNKNKTDFLIVGEKLLYKDDKENQYGKYGDISRLEWFSLRTSQSRTKLMIDEDIVEKNGKYYKHTKQTEDSGTTVREDSRRIIIIDYDENDPNSPYSFVKTHTNTFIQMHKTYFDDPLTVNTLVVKGNIKTVKSTKKTFAEEVTATHAKKPTEEQKEEGEEPDRYETLSHILIGKRKYSPDAFDKLKQRAKTLDAGSKELAQLTAKIDSAKSIWEKLSPAGIKRLSDNAFSQKEPTLGKDGKKSHKTISEADYRALPKEEQSQYKSAVNVITTQSGSSSVDVAPMTSYGKGTLSVGQVSAQTLKDDFAKATIQCEFFIQTHGRFDMNPVKRGGGNFQLANFVDETKVNINDLLELVELTPSKLIAEMGA